MSPTALLALLALAAPQSQLLDRALLTDESSTPHATLFVPPELVSEPGQPSRLALQVPATGELLYTESHEVWRGARGSVVELVGYSPTEIGGELEVSVRSGGARRHVELFRADLLALAAGGITLAVDDHRQPLAGWRVERSSSVLLLLYRHVDDVGGSGLSAHAWLELAAGRWPRARLILQLHHGLLPVRPDVYFRQLDLELSQGWEWAPELPDACMAGGHLVAPPATDGEFEVMPRTRVRDLRVVIQRAREPHQGEGWGVTTWRRPPSLAAGGFGPTGVGMPERTPELLAQARAEASRRWSIEAASLAGATADPHEGRLANGATPPSAFWPMRGVLYGGMTGGIDVDAYEGALAVLAAQRSELLRLRTEALRYGCRQHGFLFHPGGAPVEYSEALDAQGRLPSNVSGNRFVGADPFHVAAAESGDPVDGLCPHEYLVGVANLPSGQLQAIDAQHGIRVLSSLEALVWLDADPLATLRIRAQATLWAWENIGRWGTPPLGGHAGTYTGRAEAWAARAAAIALGCELGRGPGLPWRPILAQMVGHLRGAQRSCGLIMRREGGKVATAPPMGHQLADPCPAGIHQEVPDNHAEVSDLCAGRPGEDVFLLEALLAAEWTTGTPCADVRRGIARGIRDYAWAYRPSGAATAGWGDRVAVAPALAGGGWGEPFETAEEIPEWARLPYGDGYDVPVVVALGALDGEPMGAALLRWSSTSSWAAARAYVLAHAMRDLEQGALLVAVAQSIP